MFIDRKISIILVGIFTVIVCEKNDDSGYFNYNNYASDDKRSSDSNSCFEELRKCWTTKNNDIRDDTMSQRIVNMLLSRSTVWESKSIFRRYILIETSEAEEEALKKFLLGQLKIREIDMILNDAVKDGTSTFSGFLMTIYKYVFAMPMIYIYYIYIYISNQREMIMLMCILISLLATFYKFKWNFRKISLASIQVIFTTMFLISWWKVSQKKADAAAQSKQQSAICQYAKMLSIDKALTWFGSNNVCDNQREVEKQEFLPEKSPDELFAEELGEAFVDTLYLCGKFIYWIPCFITKYWRHIGAGLIVFVLGVLLPISIIILVLIKLHEFYIQMLPPGRIYSNIKNSISEFSSDAQIRLHRTATRLFPPLNKSPVKMITQLDGSQSLNNTMTRYYELSCGMEKSVILKTINGAKSWRKKSELEEKLHSVLGKRMEIERIIGSIATREGEQITVTMKLEQDKAELLERWQELSVSGIVVENDIILLHEIAAWNAFGLITKKKDKAEKRKISINRRVFTWNTETKNWVHNVQVITSETIEKNEKDKTS